MPEPKITTPPPNAVMLPYDLRFQGDKPHINVARVEGVTQKVWTIGQSGHVCARLAMRHGSEQIFCPIMLPFGKTTAGEDVTIAPDLRLRVTGYLQEILYSESLEHLLRRVHQDERVLERDRAVMIKRTATYIVAQSVEIIGAAVDRPLINSVQLEGIVQKTWTVRTNKNLFARLAIYDPQCEDMEGTEGKNGHQRKQAHYCSILFPEGKTGNGTPVSVSVKTHIMGSGHVQEIPYRESLEHALRRAGQATRIADDDEKVSLSRASVYVVVRSMTQFSR